MGTESTAMDETTYALACYIQKHLNRITVNLVRVENLVKLAEEVYPNPPKGLILYKQDLLRSAVVFLHATLEDFLRYIGMMYLPNCNEEVLNRIALVGTSDILRPEKFFLGKLVQHRGKTVEQVLSESIAAYLDRVSFSDTTDISRFLEAVGIDLELVRTHYTKLSELTSRRHQIVHKGDLIDSSTDQCREATPIAAEAVMEWHTSVKAFMSAVIGQKIQHDFASRLNERKSKEVE